MGKRTWFFRCTDCGEEFGKWFEHMYADEASEWLSNELECVECGSSDCMFTGGTTFSHERIEEDEKPIMRCKDCRNEFPFVVMDKTADEVSDYLEVMECSKCGSSELWLLDTYESSWNKY
jgi:Zn finger protein HypA/HybF involved in hydrogenase expression